MVIAFEGFFNVFVYLFMQTFDFVPNVTCLCYASMRSLRKQETL